MMKSRYKYFNSYNNTNTDKHDKLIILIFISIFALLCSINKNNVNALLIIVFSPGFIKITHKSYLCIRF